MGTGPFKFVEHVAGSHWVGAKFDDYFVKGKPYLDGFRAITLGTSAMLNAMEGEHILAEFRGFAPPERDRLVRTMGDKVKVYESDWLFQMLMSVNTKKKPFDDERVRRALSLAIDRWGASTALRKVSSLGPVGGVLMPGGKWAATEAEVVQWPGFGKNIEANRAEARRLLKEAGVENLTFTLSNRNIAPFVTVGIYMIDQWRQIGVKVQHKQHETAGWFAANAMGAGHELGTIVEDERPWGDKIKEGFEDLENNLLGTTLGLFPGSQDEKLNVIHGLSVGNWLPDGVVADGGKNNLYLKDEQGNVNRDSPMDM
jgi:peptide/nickel transport system substrate-binding protein